MMQSKYKNILDIFKPKSEEEILKAINDSGLTIDELLFKSSKIGYIKGVQLALKKGANVRCNGDSSLFTASINGHLKIVKVLLKAGANIYNNQWLIPAVLMKGYKDIAKELLQHKR